MYFIYKVERKKKQFEWVKSEIGGGQKNVYLAAVNVWTWIPLGKFWESVQLPHGNGNGGNGRNANSCQSLQGGCSEGVNSLLA